MIIGKCKHGEFELAEGCKLCIEERRQAGIRPEQDEMEDGLNSERFTLAPTEDEPTWPLTTLSLRPGEDVEAHSYHAEALKLLEYADKRVIATIEDAKLAADDLSVISRLKKAMEAKRKEKLAPHEEQVKAIRDTYTFLMTPVFEAERITKAKQIMYLNEQKRRQQEQEEINRKRLEAAEAEMRLKGELTESVNLVEVIEAPKRVSTDFGSTGMTTIWKFEVIDFALLPDRFKMENATLIGKVVRAGEREIPGVRIYSEDNIRTTTK